MGIRLHKMLGWALTNLKRKDPRVDWDSVSKACRDPSPDLVRKLKEFSVQRSREMSEKGQSSNSTLGRLEEGKLRVHRNLVATTESFPKVICIGDGNPDHYRYDDILDFTEEETCHSKPPKEGGGSEGRIVKLPVGYFPYYNCFMDCSAGKRAPVRMFNGKIELHYDNHEMNKSFQKYTQATLKRIFVPHVPESVREICEFFHVFNKPDTVLELRPVLWTYWE